MSSRNAPVVVFAYSRRDHLEETLNALNNSTMCSETDLFIFCDNFKKEIDKEKVNRVREFVDYFKENNNFKNVFVEKAENNKGLKKSIIEGVTKVIAQYGKVIVVEDDLKTSPHFIRFMNEALDYYELNDQIWSISGYTFEMKSLDNYMYDVYFTGRGCSWGWATWKNRWDTIDWDVKDYRKFKHNYSLRKEFSKWGADLPSMLDGQMSNGINSWAIIWCYEAFRQGKLTVYPRKSLLSNIGNDGSGTHGSKASNDFFTVIDPNPPTKYNFVTPNIDKRIQKEFSKRFCHGINNILKLKIKTVLRKLGLFQKLRKYKNALVKKQ